MSCKCLLYNVGVLDGTLIWFYTPLLTRLAPESARASSDPMRCKSARLNANNWVRWDRIEDLLSDCLAFWHAILEHIPQKRTERGTLRTTKCHPLPVIWHVFYFKPIIEVWSKKVERILLKFLYNKRMAKRVEDLTHICSQDIHQFLSVNNWFLVSQESK